MQKTVKYLKFITVILPLLFLITGLNFNRARYINDPDYIYLINALVICDGQSVGHVDNPGTTVMQLGAAAIFVIHLFSNTENETLINHVIKDPDTFIEGIRVLFIILNSIALFFLGWIAIKKTGSLWAALILQLTAFISANMLDHVWSKVSPEPLLLLITSIYVICILCCFYEETKRNNLKWILIFALVTGAGLGTKATFLPLVIFPLFIFSGIKQKLIYLFSIIPSFILFTIPAVPEYKSMFFWFRNLIHHSGIYGQGESTFIDPKTYIISIFEIIKNNPILGIILVAGIIILTITLIKRRKNKIQSFPEIPYLAGLLATLIFGILLVAKHYSGDHYLIPILLLSGITIYFSERIIIQILPDEKLKKIVFPLITTLLFISLIDEPKKWHETSKNYRISTEEIDKTNNLLENEYAGYTLIHYYTFSMNKFTALKFGDVYAKGKIRSYLKEIYNDTYFYDFHNNQFLFWNTEVTLEEIVENHGNKILLVNGTGDERTITEIANRGFPLTAIYKGNVQNIYALDTLQFAEFQLNNQKIITETITCDAETVSEDGEFLIDIENRNFGKTTARTDEVVRSGQHAIKLDESNLYAIEYAIDNLVAGDFYEIEVWRKADNQAGYLVVSADDQNLFYKAQNEFVTTELNGWSLIRIDAEINKDLQNKRLVVYLWNAGKEITYFDDLTIRKIKYLTENQEIQ
jgi:hypothetical protein